MNKVKHYKYKLISLNEINEINKIKNPLKIVYSDDKFSNIIGSEYIQNIILSDISFVSENFVSENFVKYLIQAGEFICSNPKSVFYVKMNIKNILAGFLEKNFGHNTDKYIDSLIVNLQKYKQEISKLDCDMSYGVFCDNFGKNISCEFYIHKHIVKKIGKLNVDNYNKQLKTIFDVYLSDDFVKYIKCINELIMDLNITKPNPETNQPNIYQLNRCYGCFI
jgi:hypothetical protein